MITTDLPKPPNWQDFEEICYVLYRDEYNDPRATRYGRTGQKQYGIDIFARNGEQKVGIQCKCYKKLTLRTIQQEIRKAEQGPLAFDLLIFATTADNDACLINDIEKLSETRRREGKFQIHVAFWDELQALIRRNEKVAQAYYPHLPGAFFSKAAEGQEAIQKQLAAIQAAIGDIAPSSIPTVIAKEKKKLETLDPRFNVDISYADNVTQYSISAKEPVQGAFLFKGGSNPQRLREQITALFERGQSIHFAPGEVQVTGSPLWATISEDLNQHGVILSASRKTDCTFTVSAVTAEGDEVYSLPNFPGTIEGGTKEARFKGVLSRSPISLSGRVTCGAGQGDITFNFDVNRWAGQPALQAAYFDAVGKLLDFIRSGHQIKVSCDKEGNHLVSGIIHDMDFNGTMALYIPFIELLKKVRSIGTQLKISPLISPYEQIAGIDYFRAEILWQIITTGEYRQPVEKNFTVSGQFKPSKELIAETRPWRTSGKELIFVPEETELLGTAIPGLRLQFRLTKSQLTKESKAALKDYGVQHSEWIKLCWVPCKGAELIVRIFDDAKAGKIQ